MFEGPKDFILTLAKKQFKKKKVKIKKLVDIHCYLETKKVIFCAVGAEVEEKKTGIEKKGWAFILIKKGIWGWKEADNKFQLEIMDRKDAGEFGEGKIYEL